VKPGRAPGSDFPSLVRWPAKRAARSLSLFPLRFRLFELVADAETLAGGVVHLPGGLLGVLQLGETILDLGELLLDLALELLDFSLRDSERVFVELLLVA